MEDYRLWIEKIIKDFIGNPEINNLKNKENDRAWDEPIVGFSRGDDPLYEDYKRYVGSFHFTPEEIFKNIYPGLNINKNELTVICWILPHTEKTKSEQRNEANKVTESWARGRIFGEEINVKLRKYLVKKLEEKGIHAISPVLTPYWQTVKSDKYQFASTWSERHAAYASGLGTFGLCDGLITSKGKAMRCGSVIAQIAIPTSTRPYKDHHEYCLFFSKGTCGRCIGRCPANAIGPNGHDKIKCKRYVDETAYYVKTRYGFEGYGCGFCQTGVPCESKIPNEKDL